MKLNNTQIKALAQEVLNKLPKTEKAFTKDQLKTIKPLVIEITKLKKDIDILINKKQSFISQIKETNLFNNLYDGDCSDLNIMTRKLKKPCIPSLDDVVHQITLETIFETKETMTDFINNLVKYYSK